MAFMLGAIVPATVAAPLNVPEPPRVWELLSV
jgi:hypothetical protein